MLNTLSNIMNEVKSAVMKNQLMIFVVAMIALVVAMYQGAVPDVLGVRKAATMVMKNEGEAQLDQQTPVAQQAQQAQRAQQAKQVQQGADQQEQGSVAPSSTHEEFAQVDGLGSRNPAQSCVDMQGQWISSNLLPKDDGNADEDWSALAPGKLDDQNFLEAGHHFGADTVANSLRNANYQLRSEPANPKVEVGPWSNTTIDEDKLRRRFDIE